MTMSNNGLAKLAEELGELQQVVGKMLAYGYGEHPDGKGLLADRFVDEAGDVIAAITFVVSVNDLDDDAINVRSKEKFNLYVEWHNA